MKFAVIGSGTWGSALTQVLTDNGYDAIIYGKDQSQVDDINNNHRNAYYFGNDIAFDPRIKATSSLAEAVKDRDVIILSIPSAAFREVLGNLVPLLTKKTIFINTAKGFDTENDTTLSTLLRELIPEEDRYPIVSLIGPSHAEEVIIRDLIFKFSGLSFSSKLFSVYLIPSAFDILILSIYSDIFYVFSFDLRKVLFTFAQVFRPQGLK